MPSLSVRWVSSALFYIILLTYWGYKCSWYDLFSFWAYLSSRLRSCLQQLQSAEYIERHPSEICFAFHGTGLPTHRIPGVFHYSRKPRPFCSLRAGGLRLKESQTRKALRAGSHRSDDSIQSTAPPSGLEASRAGSECTASLFSQFYLSCVISIISYSSFTILGCRIFPLWKGKIILMFFFR